MKISKDLKQILKTLTIGGDCGPSHSICMGHVDLPTFNKAFKAEGWESDGFDPELVSHEYWSFSGHFWQRSKQGDPGAVPVTVGAW